jgi:hypothetical protein
MTWKRFQTTRPSESELRAWFARDRYALAVVLGSVSGGLVCRDFDAMEAFDAWAAEYPKFAKELPTVETGRPGRHVYCRADVDQVRQVSRSGGGIIDLGDGELRGSGGYCLLPPSRHPSGHNYRWLVPLRAPIPFLDLNSCGFLKNFERLVVELLVAMGYGGSLTDAGKAVGRTGDGGIDGIIKEDRLGLDVVCIQAKRWQNTVGRPTVQEFAGSMAGFRAKKGVLITTSRFTKDAHEYVERIEQRIVLIDGDQLADFMIDHNIGVTRGRQYEIKRVPTRAFR